MYCIKSHDLDLILDEIQGTIEKTAKRPKLVEDKTNLKQLQQRIPNFITERDFEHRHTAAYDSYMTGLLIFTLGYVFYCYLARITDLKDCENKIYLIGKQIPLIIVKSKYANYSVEHSRKSRSEY